MRYAKCPRCESSAFMDCACVVCGYPNVLAKEPAQAEPPEQMYRVVEKWDKLRGTHEIVSVEPAPERPDDTAAREVHMRAVKFADDNDDNSDIEEGRWTIAYDAFRSGFDAGRAHERQAHEETRALMLALAREEDALRAQSARLRAALDEIAAERQTLDGVLALALRNIARAALAGEGDRDE